MNAKIISKNLCLIILVFIILYFIYKFLKGYEGFDMPDESLFYKTKNKILQNAAQANN
jgi:hypothetical protein